MYIFGEIKNKLKKLDINKICKDIFSYDFIKSWIIETIQKRLYEEGTDSDGNVLRTTNSGSGEKGFYARFTENTKTLFKTPAQPIDRVTLKDSGEFYDSFQVIAYKTFFSIKAKFDKENGHIFENFTDSYSNKLEFEKNILSLDDTEFDIFTKEIFYPEFATYFNNEFKKCFTRV